MKAAVSCSFIAALALVLAVVVGCGDDSELSDNGSLHVGSATVPLCYTIGGTPAPGCPTPTPTPQPTCVPTLGVPSCCAASCEPCPTIRAGCNAQACQDCIERPACDPIPTCGPSEPIRIPPDGN